MSIIIDAMINYLKLHWPNYSVTHHQCTNMTIGVSVSTTNMHIIYLHVRNPVSAISTSRFSFYIRDTTCLYGGSDIRANDLYECDLADPNCFQDIDSNLKYLERCQFDTESSYDIDMGRLNYCLCRLSKLTHH